MQVLNKQINPVLVRIVHVLSILALLAGVMLRLAVYIENRNLNLDEANLARNVYEQSFRGLAGPLPHGTFAPIPYLWITKLEGFISWHEMMLKALPFICGIGALFLFWTVIKKLVGRGAALYPLIMVATGLIFIRYTTELKQYSSDMLITLLLIWLTLRVNIATASSTRFVAVWSVAGGLAIWFSMPSLFVLSGVGLYYGYGTLRDRKKILPLILVACFWASQFLLYYFLVLNKFVASSYLQAFHAEYFLHLLPTNAKEWTENGAALNDFLTSMWGKYGVSFGLNLLAIVVGIVYFIRKDKRKALLFIAPIITVLVAAGLHKYTLIARVMLFVMPIVFILIGKGFERMLRIKGVNVIVATAAIICIVNYSEFGLFTKRYDVQETVPTLRIIKEAGITGDRLFAMEIVFSNYYYYTYIHPSSSQFQSLRGGRQFEWNTRMDSLAGSVQGPCAFMYGTVEPSIYEEHRKQIASVKQIDHEDGRLETKVIFCK